MSQIIIRHPEPIEFETAKVLNKMELPTHRPESDYDERIHHAEAVQMSAFIDGQMVSTVTLSPVLGQENMYEIDRIVTLPKYRRQGIGSQVLLAAEAAVAGLGGHTFVLDSRPAAHDFFGTLGYIQTDSHRASGHLEHVNMTKRI